MFRREIFSLGERFLFRRRSFSLGERVVPSFISSLPGLPVFPIRGGSSLWISTVEELNKLTIDRFAWDPKWPILVIRPETEDLLEHTEIQIQLHVAVSLLHGRR